MINLKFYRFISQREIHYFEDKYEDVDAVIFLYLFDLESFMNLLYDGYTDGNPIDAHIGYDYICIDLKDIIECHAFCELSHLRNIASNWDEYKDRILEMEDRY